jgi:hypothetical protein
MVASPFLPVLGGGKLASARVHPVVVFNVCDRQGVQEPAHPSALLEWVSEGPVWCVAADRESPVTGDASGIVFARVIVPPAGRF